MKPNTKFELSVRDIEIIEHALRAKAGRRGLAIANGETSPQLKQEMHEIQELLGRIHEQKVWYHKMPKGQIYVSG
jgi:ribonuclease PH